jgi:hypothetical protein
VMDMKRASRSLLYADDPVWVKPTPEVVSEKQLRP